MEDNISEDAYYEELLRQVVSDDESAVGLQSPAPVKNSLPKYDTSFGGAALSGAGQSITGGFGDEAAAGIGAVGDVAAAGIGMRGDISLGDAYRTRLKHVRELDRQQAEQHPAGFLGGALGGGVALGAAMPWTAPNTVKGALGAGAVMGYGTSEESLLKNPIGSAKDIAIGAGGGVAGKYAGDKLGNLYKSLREKSKKAAIDSIYRRKSGAIDKIRQLGMYDDLGEALTSPLPDKSLPKASRKPIVSAGRDPEAMEKAAEAHLNYYGGKIGQARKDVDAYDLAVVDTDNIASKIRQIGNRYGKNPEAANLKQRINELADFFEANKGMKMSDLEAEKKSFQWKFKEDDPDLASQINKIIRDEERATISRGSQMTAIPDMEANLNQFPQSQRRYATLSDAEKKIGKEVAREHANRNMSLTDYMTALGVVGATAGTAAATTSVPAAALVGITLGIPAVMMHRFLRERGSSIASAAFREMANALDNQGASAAYMPLFKAAARKGPEAVVILHNTLKRKYPDYNEATQQGVQQ